MQRAARRRPSAVPALYAAWFLLNVAMYAGEFGGAFLAPDRPVAGILPYLFALPFAAVFTAAAAASIGLARRVPLGQRPWLRGLLVHAAAAVGAAALVHAVRLGFRLLLARAGPQLSPDEDRSVAESVVIVYAVLTALAQAREYSRRSREKEVQALHLQADLARTELARAAARLRALKLGLTPAFLQRCLRDAASFTESDPPRAGALVVRLSDLLRRTLEEGAVREVFLDQETESLRRLLEVEELRLPRLAVEWAIEEEALDAVVPHLVLQPLVEHAVESGPAKRIAVTAERAGDLLRLRVETRYAGDTGVEPDGRGAEPIHALRARLARLYGEGQAVHVAAGPGSLVLSVEIPWHEEPVPEPDVDDPGPGPGAAAGAEAATAPEPALPVSVPRGWAWIGWALAAAWTAMVWAIGFSGRRDPAMVPPDASPALAFACAGLNAVLWGIVPVGAFLLARRVPLSRRLWRRGLFLHGLTGLACGAAIVAGKVACRLAMGYPPGKRVPEGPLMQVFLAAVVFAAFGVAAHAWVYRRRYRERELAGVRLRAAVARAELERTTAELEMLRLQLNPHFLFNSLNAVTTLIPRDPVEAASILRRLADLVAHVTASPGVVELPLEEEIEGLHPFLDIERVRHPGVRVVWEVDPSARGARVPRMLLQPLVENALKHGLAPRGGDGTLRVGAHTAREWTVIEVTDDGVGLAAAAGAPRRGTGVGLANLRARLERMYGADQRFEIVPNEGGGTRVTVALRRRDRPADPSAVSGGAA